MLGSHNIYLILTFIIALIIFCRSEEHIDLIKTLPGLNENATTFRQYSGYLDVGDGRHLFYWFVESKSNPEKDPLLLWLTGGPACSSIYALFVENGPWRVSPNGSDVYYDSYSWNTLANVLYLDSPAGVGFSYIENTNSNDIKTSDNETAHYNYLAVKKFFEKFPQFAKNDFYITGESYAGVYIPTLTSLILQQPNSTINLKGLAIGNGWFDQKIYSDSRWSYAHYHGLIDTTAWNEVTQQCCSCAANGQQVCDFPIITPNYTIIATNNSGCSEKVGPMIADFLFSGIDMYNIYNFCPDFSAESAASEQTHECVSDGYMKYLDNREVQASLHLRNDTQNWLECNTIMRNNYRLDYSSMQDTLKMLVSSKKLNPIIIYNGDSDMVCDLIGAQNFLDSLELQVVKNYSVWRLNGKPAGFVKRYDGLSFVTVRGSGHMVPMNKPMQVLKIVEELIGKSVLN